MDGHFGPWALTRDTLLTAFELGILQSLVVVSVRHAGTGNEGVWCYSLGVKIGEKGRESEESLLTTGGKRGKAQPSMES